MNISIPKCESVNRQTHYASFPLLLLPLILHIFIDYKFLDEVLWLVLYDYYRMLFSCGFLHPKAFNFINYKYSSP